MSGPAECNTNTHRSRSPIAIGPIKVMLDNSLDEQNVHSAGPHSYLTLLSLVQWHLEDDSYVYLYYILLDQTDI
jgi:hypothetical protein